MIGIRNTIQEYLDIMNVAGTVVAETVAARAEDSDGGKVVTKAEGLNILLKTMSKWYDVKHTDKRINMSTLEAALVGAGFTPTHDEDGK